MSNELKALKGGDIHDLVEFGDGSEIYHDETLYYLKNAVDEALDEKDTTITESKRALWLGREWRAWCEGQFWCVLESNKPRDIFHLLCTKRIHRTPIEWINYWYKVEQLCKRKAEASK